jgi:thymidylate synthase
MSYLFKDGNQAYEKMCNNLIFGGSDVGETKETTFANFCIEDCKRNLVTSSKRSLNPFYLIGEMLWYLKGSNSLEQISYYSKFWEKISDDGKTSNSAYGYYIFNKFKEEKSQWENIRDLLLKEPFTRRAIIHLHLPNFKSTKDELCTLTLQFLIREGKLNLVVNMRSNDVYLGLPYDIAMFSVFQQMMAYELDIEVGRYYHSVGSLHFYNRNKKEIEEVINNKSNERSYLFEIPDKFFKEIDKVLVLEEELRKGKNIIVPENMCNFSKNILQMLQLYKLIKEGAKVLKFYKKIENDLELCFRTLLEQHLRKGGLI